MKSLHPAYCCCGECLERKPVQPIAFQTPRFRDALYPGHTCFDGDEDCARCAETLRARLADLASLGRR